MKILARGSVALATAVVVLTALVFQNCSGGSSNPPGAAAVMASETVTDLLWDYNNGTVTPASAYDVEYQLNLQTNTLVITVLAGSSVTTQLPAPGTFTLSSAQVTQVQTLLGQMLIEQCATGSASVGGGSDTVTLYTTSTPNMVIYGTSCTGLTDPNYRQSASGYQALTSYLATL